MKFLAEFKKRCKIISSFSTWSARFIQSKLEHSPHMLEHFSPLVNQSRKIILRDEIKNKL